MYLEYKERIACLEGILRRNNLKEYKEIILRKKTRKNYRNTRKENKEEIPGSNILMEY